MSQESVDVVRRVTDVMDAEGVEAALPVLLEAAHPDVASSCGSSSSSTAPGPWKPYGNSGIWHSRRVFDHVTIRVSDRAASERFYETVLTVIGIDETHSGEQFTEWGDFSLAPATAWNPVTRGVHLGFGAPSRERVDEFWQAGIDAGFESDGEPGPRTEYGDDYYGGFLLDPDGNSAEAVHFENVRRGVDHVWIRVRDVEASKRFYETIAPHARFGVTTDTPGRVQFTSDGAGSFSVLSGERVTEALHMAFAATDDQAVDDFHQAATEAGYRDNGQPGERPAYHTGYYSAYALDPDGHNIELVNHNL